MATTVVAVAIFLCGVQVGRGVRLERPIDTAETVASAGPTPTATTPSQPAAAGGPPAAEPPAPAPEPDDELSYAKRLQGDQGGQTEKLKAATPAPPAARPEPAAPPAAVAARPAPPTAPPVTKAAASKPAPVPAAAAGRPGGWIVQITALQDRNACATIAQRLAGKGYPAFVLDPAPGSPTIYRVQVGGY